MNLELKISDKLSSIDEFVLSIQKTDSKFKIHRWSSKKAIVRLRSKPFSLMFNFQNPAVSLVCGIIDHSVTNNLLPFIKIRPTLLYRFIQVLVLFPVPQVFFLGIDLETIIVTFIFSGGVLGLMHLFYVIGEGIFYNLLYEEIT